jgi:hypothetical protein
MFYKIAEKNNKVIVYERLTSNNDDLDEDFVLNENDKIKIEELPLHIGKYNYIETLYLIFNRIISNKIKACEKGTDKEVRNLIHEGKDINEIDSSGSTPLHIG